MSDLSSLLETIRQIAALPPGEATSMPPEAFTSAELLTLEKARILSKEWLCVGREDEAASPGDYFTAEVNRVPLIIIRNQAGQLRCLVNVCRHRMAKLVEGQGNKRIFVCPYHAWSYDLDGKLVRAPGMDNDQFDQSRCQLPQVSLQTWLGFIYVNLDAGAEPLQPRLQPLEELIRNYRVDQMRTVWKKKLSWTTNWKVLVENFLEVYHIPTVHTKTLLPYGGYELFKRIEPGDGYSFYVQGQETRDDFSQSLVTREVLIANTQLTDFERFNTFVGCIFPSHLVSISWFGVLWLSVQPTGPDQISVDWGVVGPVEGLAINADSYSEYSFPEWIDAVNNEDKSRVEAVQQGARSGFAGVGPLHRRYEETILHFIRYLSDKLSP